MKHLFLAASLFTLPLMAEAQQPSLRCDAGPANKTYGGTPWYIYACTDKHTVVVVTAPGSPATPFVFTFAYKNGAYQLLGEGAGNKTITDAAYIELSALNTSQVAALHSEASRVSKK